jgi:hypothetical protein
MIDLRADQIIGEHPDAPHPCGIHLEATDQYSAHDVPHRVLDDAPLQVADFTASMADWLVTHHASPEAIARDRVLHEVLARQGLPNPARSRIPNNPNTQKGNWAEILLAEYLVASCDAELPVYRLRYNTNVDQSMKGDDVLAFDLDSNPVRILVGEAKFRATPSKAVVEELVGSLVRSHSVNIPASLQFVAELLFNAGNNELGARVVACNALFAERRLQLDYVGLLVSNREAHRFVRTHAETNVRRLAVVSLGLSDAEGMVTTSFAEARRRI